MICQVVYKDTVPIFVIYTFHIFLHIFFFNFSDNLQFVHIFHSTEERRPKLALSFHILYPPSTTTQFLAVF